MYHNIMNANGLEKAHQTKFSLWVQKKLQVSSMHSVENVCLDNECILHYFSGQYLRSDCKNIISMIEFKFLNRTKGICKITK